MIRVASAEDIEIVSRMALEFIQKTAYAPFFEPGSVTALVEHLILSDNAERIILLEEEGRAFLAAVKTPFYFGKDYIATEIGWWVDEEHRQSGLGQELLNAFEYWAKQVGCKMMTMISLDDQVENLYKKQGYKLFERAYMKVL